MVAASSWSMAMGSWIECTCGNLLHRNLFAGARIGVVIEDDDLDAIPETGKASEVIDQIISKGDRLLRCRNCGRIVIESKKSGTFTIYSPEPVSPEV